MMLRSTTGWIWGAAALLLGTGASPALAHTSFLWPSTFSTGEAQVITLQAAFGETHYFRPEIAVTSDDFHLYPPEIGRAHV